MPRTARGTSGPLLVLGDGFEKQLRAARAQAGPSNAAARDDDATESVASHHDADDDVAAPAGGGDDNEGGENNNASEEEEEGEEFFPVAEEVVALPAGAVEVEEGGDEPAPAEDEEVEEDEEEPAAADQQPAVQPAAAVHFALPAQPRRRRQLTHGNLQKITKQDIRRMGEQCPACLFSQTQSATSPSTCMSCPPSPTLAFCSTPQRAVVASSV